MPRSLVVLVLAVAGGCFGGGPCDNPGPSNDTCAKGETGAVGTLEIGPGNQFSEADSFQPWNDGDAVEVVRGGQGASMIVARLRVSGPSAPACLGQTLGITDGVGTGITYLKVPLTTYPTGEDLGLTGWTARVTHAIFLPAQYPAPGQHLIVTDDAGGLSVSKNLIVDTPEPHDLALGDLVAAD